MPARAAVDVRRGEKEVEQLEEAGAVLDKENAGVQQAVQLDVKVRVVAVKLKNRGLEE